MRGNKTLDVSSSDDEMAVDPVKPRVEEKERFPNGVKKMNAEPKRKREPAATDNGVKAKAPQKRRLNQSAAKTAKQQRGSADRGTGKPPEGPEPMKSETVAAVKSEDQSACKSESTANSVKKEPKARIKVEYGLPGQTKPTPAENDPKRKFYTSLMEEHPRSELARRWCVMHGLMDNEFAEEWMKESETKKKREAARKRYAKEVQFKKEQGLKKEEIQ